MGMHHHHMLSHSPVPGRYSPPYRVPDRVRNHSGIHPSSTGSFFSGLDDGLLARAEVLAAVDINKSSPPHHLSSPPHHLHHHQLTKPDAGLYCHTEMSPPGFHPHGMHRHPPPQMQFQGFGSTDGMLDPMTCNPGPPAGMPMGMMPEHHPGASGGSGGPPHHNGHMPQMYPPAMYTPNPMNMNMNMNMNMAMPHGMPPLLNSMHHPMRDAECDPRELEAFAERFKQRRIKLGVTQADVGCALAKLKLPGVGALSQSTICRFESLTLSHNNMIALKPILTAWLEGAEKQARDQLAQEEAGMCGSSDKKRKRTSIAAPEKRSLEAYFAVQPRPSGEKIAQIAEKLDLKKNVVRVWFCNQRQKQKRMKFSATTNHQ